MAGILPSTKGREPQQAGTHSLNRVAVSYQGKLLPVNGVSAFQPIGDNGLSNNLHEYIRNISIQLVDLLSDGKAQQHVVNQRNEYSFKTYRRCSWVRDETRLIYIEVRNGIEISISLSDVSPDISPPKNTV
ncbi:hypothetical protein [Thiothrix winogradskyi]|uniref:Uncharacterized protein n=1 Tax=Thiothrix winogradskyi TaxID=96472 RepID=A0ABY3SWX6_9GAMM|nr:hypothetical protein [Thiothrix winogradskyi]UJS23442.1 hypothetical protein L2Y54_16025 [Thiothrix winogradskyi]